MITILPALKPLALPNFGCAGSGRAKPGPCDGRLEFCRLKQDVVHFAVRVAGETTAARSHNSPRAACVGKLTRETSSTSAQRTQAHIRATAGPMKGSPSQPRGGSQRSEPPTPPARTAPYSPGSFYPTEFMGVHEFSRELQRQRPYNDAILSTVAALEGSPAVRRRAAAGTSSLAEKARRPHVICFSHLS